MIVYGYFFKVRFPLVPICHKKLSDNRLRIHNREEMDRIFSNKQVLHITEWYTFSEVRDMSGLKTETICGIVKKHKIPKKKVNNIEYLSKRQREEARGNTIKIRKM